MSSLSLSPAVDRGTDPTLVVAAYKKNRFYLFSCRSPRDLSSVDNDRDVFNEKPSKEDIISATEEKGAPRLYQSATIHTTVGDIHLELFPKVSVIIGTAVLVLFSVPTTGG